MGIKNEEKKEEGLFEGFRTQEQRDLAMLTAALNREPEYFGEMNKEQKQEYEKLVKELSELPPNVSVDVGYNMD